MDVTFNILENISRCNDLLLQDPEGGDESSQLCNNFSWGKPIHGGVGAKRLNRRVATSGKFLKCETEKRIALKSNRMVIFHNKWKTYEELLEESR